MPRARAPIPVRAGSTQFLKINAARRDWRDSYHWVLSLTWPQFALFLVVTYLVINTFFALFYVAGRGAIAEMEPGSFPQAFFFSVETLATVGYGHQYPATAYGHIMVTAETFAGTIWFAVITGLIFVRFSRPTARIVFSNSILIGNHNGRPSVMFRVANLRHTSMVDARFRLMLSRDEKVLEGEVIRRFHHLKVYPRRIARFPAALTIRHTITETSPLYGETEESLKESDAFFIAEVSSVETLMAASVQSQKDYSWSDIRWGERFEDIYEELSDGTLQVDYGRIHDTEPVPPPAT
jgi:inward rectifier potassium channel